MAHTQIMRFYFTLICICTTVVLHAQQWYFWIEEYTTAQRPLLSTAKEVLWVNNTCSQPEDFGHVVMVDGTTVGGVAVSLDDAALRCLFAATQAMDESMELSRVELLEQSQNRSGNYYTRQLMKKNQLHALCQKYHVDALVVLNQLVLYDVVESYLTDQDAYYAYMQAYAQSHWSVYDANNHQLTSFTHGDTLLWESRQHHTQHGALQQLPTQQEALLYLASEVGDNVSESLLPQWISVKRYLYENANSHLQAGLQSFRYQRWEEAIYHWQMLIDNTDGEDTNSSKSMKASKGEGKDKKTAAMAAANIAIAYEMLGDYPLACAYADKACRLFGAWKTAYGRQQQVNIRYYLEQLQAKQVK